MQDSEIQDPRIFKDVDDPEYNKIVDIIVRQLQTVKKSILNAGKILENKGWNKENICGQISRDARQRGATKGQIAYIRECCPRQWKDERYDNIGEANLALENLISSLEFLTVEQFTELKDSPRDKTHVLAKCRLTEEQVNLFGDTEREEWFNARRKRLSELNTEYERLKELFDVKDEAEINKEQTVVPFTELRQLLGTERRIEADA